MLLVYLKKKKATLDNSNFLGGFIVVDTSLLEQLMGTHYLRINLLKNLGDLFITGFYRKKSDGTI